MAERKVDIFILAHDQASKELQKVGSSAKGMGGILGGLKGQILSTFAGFGLANLATSAVKSAAEGLKELVLGTAETGDELARLSQSTGASVEFLSALSYGARKADVDLGAVKTAFRTMAKSAVDAANGSKSAVDQFATLGISVTDSSGKVKGMDRLFLEAAESISRMGTETERVAAAQAVFGRSGIDLLPMVQGGAAGIRDMAAEASKFGRVWSQAQVSTATAFDDAWKQMKESVGGVFKGIALAVMPVVQEIAGAVQAFFKENRSTIVSVVMDVISFVKDLFSVIWSIAKPVVEAVIKLFQMIWPAFKAVARALMSAWNSVAAAFKPVFDFLAKGFEVVWWVVDKILTGIVAMVAAIEALATVAKELARGNFDLGSLASKASDTFANRMEEYFRDKDRKTVDTFKAAVVDLPKIDTPTPLQAGQQKKTAQTAVEQKLAPLVSRMLTRAPGTRDSAAEDRRRQYEEQKKATELLRQQVKTTEALLAASEQPQPVAVIGRF